MPAIQIVDISKYISSQKIKAAEMILLDPLPKPQKQIGGTCGYYAMSITTNYWYFKCGSKRYAARKVDDEPFRPYTSLRTIGKSVIPGREIDKTVIPDIGAIFDVKYFCEIFNKIDYKTGDI